MVKTTTMTMRESVNLLSLTKWMNDWPVTLWWLTTTRRKKSEGNECHSFFPQWPWWGRWSPSVSSSSIPLTCFSLPVRSRRHPSSCLSIDDRARTLERENSLCVSSLYPNWCKDWLCGYQCLGHKHILLDNDHQKNFKCNIKWRHIHYVCVYKRKPGTRITVIVRWCLNERWPFVIDIRYDSFRS